MTQTADLINRPFPKPETIAEQRKKVLEYLRGKVDGGAILIKGLVDQYRPRSDQDPYFRQDSNFWYITGVNIPGCEVFVDIKTGKTVLFYPEQEEDFEMWAGPQPTLADIREKYQLDEVLLVTEKEKFLKESGITKFYNWDDPILVETFEEVRQCKLDGEIEIMKYSAEINNLAYRRVLQNLKPGMFEFQVEAEMQYVYYNHSCYASPFQMTVCSGPLCAILHYHKKSRQIQDGDLVLIDAGGEYEMYCADNTRTYPASGKFSDDQKVIYTAVLNTQKAVINAAKAGKTWAELAMLSARTMAKDLIDCGLLIGTIDEVVNSGALEAFYPHGLGHGMGLDVHEIGGWPKGTTRPKTPHMRYLRMGRTLEPGMVMTVEPGCYFAPGLYERALADPERAKHINADLARRFQKTVGGVRIEDDIVITKDGCFDLSINIPKEIDEIEALMAKK
ncbi:Clan MG, family M24, aminopeptidase P-like metallopeptidase [Trichomonas vaginalis G3]|uniref:Clan MG, familly M24, aminopeptidase P-like metallopeptidase n=1 Tax=Trichomonas vaginalis (strain ATCC PRA-98 / G3) TaxID=412133 RepID=A2FK66_TRIV3|nr:XAA-PRO dIpeptidase family [Trichomonas vaginalis G3]EAX94706.1 Clan MG, family M24, aminopeptidase P-like metallopeptidase [Trichomonas vaginalis G3]KAI5504136.1 XAA-PRO dIpeptidase family [Trichomonas vaginalis G3]|eukprot:XP_001307636.1 Clan MG, familly M24, aminopeptidase P-like metallopeptidase [Trichomonas vaginalis G3]